MKRVGMLSSCSICTMHELCAADNVRMGIPMRTR